MDESLEAQAQLVRARATINLPGLPSGRTADVDPSEPYVAEAITYGYLVLEEAPATDDHAVQPES